MNILPCFSGLVRTGICWDRKNVREVRRSSRFSGGRSATIMKNERRSQIKAYISEHKSARIEDLAKQNPDVSLMTLRRDLAALEEEGFLVRVRGGAYINSTPPATQAEDLYSRREISNVEAKTIICEKALPFLEEKRSIFFDAGTTLMTLVRRIPDQDLVVFTSAPNIAMEIVMRTTMPQVSLLGGSLSRNTISCSGHLTLEYLRSINIDVAFMATSGYSVENGFSSGNPYEASIKTEIVRKAHKVIMLMSSDKVGRNLPYTFARMEDIDVLICEQEPEPDVMAAARQSGVTVL